MTTISPPATHGQLEGDVGFSYVFAAEGIRLEIAERLDPIAESLAVLYGDLTGQGSDVMRITRMGGVGFAEAMTAMSTETEPIVASGFTTAYDTITLARYGLAKEESYQAKILSREGRVNLDALATLIADSWLKTLRVQVATTGATITGVTGTSGTAWTFDDELDLVAYYHETEGFEGDVMAVRHPEQFTDLRGSLRTEPNYQFPEITDAIQTLRGAGGALPMFLGIKNFSSFDVTASGGDHIGFSYVNGAIGWVRASTMGVQVEDPDRAIIVPEFGLLIEFKSSGNIATARFDANAWFGTGLLDPTLFPQRRIRSVND